MEDKSFAQGMGGSTQLLTTLCVRCRNGSPNFKNRNKIKSCNLNQKELNY